MTIDRTACLALDAADPLAFARSRFVIPDGLIYLAGNSLGLPPITAGPKVAQVIEAQWARNLVGGWNKDGWLDLPKRIGAALAPMIGAHPDEVIAADSTSINIFKLATAALRLRSPRRVIITEPGNFPTGPYMMQGLSSLMEGGLDFQFIARDQIPAALGPDTALLFLTHVHYQTGELHDMNALTQAAHEAGALTLWDLSHSAGSIDVDLNEANADFAVGCGYKYLNGGPGAPAYLYVARRHQDEIAPSLSGWLGHADPFSFVDEYQPGAGMVRQQCGTPCILGMAGLAEGVATFDGVSMSQLRAKSGRLGDLFIQLVEARCPQMEVACERDSRRRGSQVSLAHPHGYAIIQALIARQVVGDYRTPLLRFGLPALYVRYVDVWDAVEHLHAVLTGEEWRRFPDRPADVVT